MSYSELLIKLLDEKEISNSEFSRKAKEMGIDIDKSYISKLISGTVKAPSETKSKQIAKVFGVDERRLVIEGYIENAPNEIKDFFDDLRETMYLGTIKLFTNNEGLLKGLNQNIEALLAEAKKQPISDFILQLSSNDIFSKLGENFGEITKLINIDKDTKQVNGQVTFNEPLALEVTDSAMYPLIPKGAKVSFDLPIVKNNEGKDILQYKNGDKIGIKYQDKFLVRTIVYSGDNISLIPLDTTNYDIITVQQNEITILGKVNRIIINL